MKKGAFDFLFKAKDREPFPVEHTYCPILQDDEVTAIQLILRDVTERKKETALKESEDILLNTVFLAETQ